jgi:hypothetical protein
VRLRLESLARVLAGAALASCSQPLPDCPPGTDFDDCRPVTSTGSVRPAQPSSGGGSSPGSAPAAASAGAGSERPPLEEGDDLDPPDPANPASNMPTQPVAMVDNCPMDPAKTQPGICGCGTPDDDFDGDDALDCIEDCPDNPDRTIPDGPCGCSSLADVAACQSLRDGLRNLYTFDGSGVQILDSIGDQDGTLLDDDGVTPTADLARMQVNGRLNLDGFGAHVDLPDGLISSLTNATFEIWLSWRGGAFWTRIFDFGSNAGGAGQTYLFLTPSNSENSALRVAYSLAGGGAAETLVNGLAALPIGAGASGGAPQHVAVVVDGSAGSLRLYSNGSELGAVPLADDLTAIDDVNNWLGRSNYTVDPPLFGALIEFRIYERVLTPAELRTSFEAGPGALQ